MYEIDEETKQIAVLTVMLGTTEAPAVQIVSRKGAPERIVCLYENHETLEYVQISKNENVTGVVCMKGGLAHQLSPDGSFTIQIRGSSTSEAIQLTPEGTLVFAKSDGTQWRWTGSELLSMQMVAGNNSPRARLQAAKNTDAALN